MDRPELGYNRKHFDPGKVHRQPALPADRLGKRREAVYVYTDEIILAVNVAMATGRPLLVRGESGSGKSSLARNVADFLGWRCYQKVITSRTEARDLMWDVDLLRRLHDAQNPRAELSPDLSSYVVPQVLWWAFDRNSAAKQGFPDPQDVEHERAVVLLDEIDKADPDLPNNLLEPLGSLRFAIDELPGTTVAADEKHAPLVFVTTNEERELPPAFLRRCAEVTLERPRRSRLLEITRAHFPDLEEKELLQIANAVLGEAPVGAEERELPLGPADFLDTVRAQRDLEVALEGDTWKAMTAITAWKHGRQPAPS